MTGFKSGTLSSTAIMSGIALLAMLPAPALAQDTAAKGQAAAAAPKDENVPSASQPNEEGDIIVTARKRAENIQTVPIAITAYTAQDLAARNISNFADLGNSTPGVNITSITGGTVLQVFVRGLSPANTANDLNVDANVGIFIDGIYQVSRNTADIISVLDVGQIEIDKGPQSATYGRSTFAGALAIKTRPTSKELEGSFSGTVGQDEDYRAKATISGPLTDTLSARVAGGYVTYDGYGKNLANTKDNLGGVEKYAVNASVEFDPSDAFHARLSGLLTDSKSELSPTTTLPVSAFNCGNTTTSALAGASVAAPRGQLYCGTLPVSKNSSLEPNAPDTHAKNRQVSLDLNYDFGPASLISTTGYTNSNQKTYNDYDGSSAGTTLGVCVTGATCVGVPAYTRLTAVNALSTSIERNHTFQQELRLQSSDESRFEWLVGGNYFRSTNPIAAGGIGVSPTTPLAATERLVAVNLSAPPAAGVGAYEFTANPFLVASSTASQVYSSFSQSFTHSWSAFGSLGYKFGDFHVNAEGRYNVDKKGAQVFAIPNAASAPGVYQPIPGTSNPNNPAFVGGVLYRNTFKSFAPRFTADWQATPDFFLYVSAAKGIRSGGFNTASPATGAANGILPAEASYDEETNWTYEAGFKSNLLDDRLLLNASVFHVDWKNAQVSGFTQNPIATVVNRIVLNIGDIKTTGFEAQADYKVSDMFSFGGNFSYSDPKFQSGVYDGGTVTQCVVGAATGATAVAGPGANGCPAQIVVPRGAGVGAVPSLKGLRPQRSVKTQWNAHATVNFPITEEWRFAGRVDVNYVGPQFNNLLNTISFGKRTLTNLRLGVDNEKFSLAVFANNLFDKKYVQNSINQPRIGIPFSFSVPEIYLGETRRVGVTGTVKF